MDKAEPSDGHTILIVEDEHSIRKALREYLEVAGYRVLEAGSAEEASKSLALGGCDLVTLDLGLGSSDGLDLAREIKSASDLPIIMITARANEVDRVVGLEIGADDYVTKPFAMREVLARVRAVLRRSQRSSGASVFPKIGQVCFSEFSLDKEARLVRRLTGEKVDLTAGEYTLLMAFLDRPGRVLSRNELLDLTNPNDSAAFDRSIDTLVSRLRKKLMPADGSQEILKTVRGAGYMLTVPVKYETASSARSHN